MDYEIGVIGGGPGGYVAAIKAAQMGASVVLFERDSLGGTCLNRGCIPTKALLKSAQVYRQALDAAAYGVKIGEVSLSLQEVMARKDGVVGQLVSGVGGLLRKNGVQVVKASAELLGDGIVRVDGERWLCRDVILAMGSKPARPPIPGIEHAWNSDDVLSMESVPSSVVIVGGGVIGVEFASLLSAFGAEVTIVEMLPSVLAMADDLVIEQARKILARQGVKIHCGAAVREILPGEVVFQDQDGVHQVRADAIVVATGRVPNVDIKRLDALGIAHDHGRIQTDARMRTSRPHVYAIGDLNGKSMLAHTASREAVVAVRDILGQQAAMEYGGIPSCVYTTPEISWIGMTEREAKKAGLSYKTAVFPMAANGKSLIEGESGGMVKLIADAGTGELLGGHLVCVHATDIIMELGALMGMEGVAADLAEAVHPHPTVSEAVMEAAEAILGKAVHF